MDCTSWRMRARINAVAWGQSVRCRFSRSSAARACACRPSPYASSAAILPSTCGAGLADFDQAGALLEVVHAQRRARNAPCRWWAARGWGRRSSRPGSRWCRRPGRWRPRACSSGSQLCGSRLETSRCSGAMRLLMAQASSMLRVWISAPRPFRRLGDDLGARHVGQQAVYVGLHAVDVGGVGAQQDALRQFVVLGLAEQVHGHPVGRRGAVGQHQDFAWGRRSCRCPPCRTRASWRWPRRRCRGR